MTLCNIYVSKKLLKIISTIFLITFFSNAEQIIDMDLKSARGEISDFSINDSKIIFGVNYESSEGYIQKSEVRCISLITGQSPWKREIPGKVVEIKSCDNGCYIISYIQEEDTPRNVIILNLMGKFIDSLYGKNAIIVGNKLIAYSEFNLGGSYNLSADRNIEIKNIENKSNRNTVLVKLKSPCINDIAIYQSKILVINTEEKLNGYYLSFNKYELHSENLNYIFNFILPKYSIDGMQHIFILDDSSAIVDDTIYQCSKSVRKYLIPHMYSSDINNSENEFICFKSNRIYYKNINLNKICYFDFNLAYDDFDKYFPSFARLSTNIEIPLSFYYKKVKNIGIIAKVNSDYSHLNVYRK